MHSRHRAKKAAALAGEPIDLEKDSAEELARKGREANAEANRRANEKKANRPNHTFFPDNPNEKALGAR